MGYKIIKGSDATITLNLTNKANDCSKLEPFSLVGFTGASAYFPKTDDTPIVVPASLVSADLGQLTIQLTDTDTTQLKEGDISFEVVVDQGVRRSIVKFNESILVEPRLF